MQSRVGAASVQHRAASRARAPPAPGPQRACLPRAGLAAGSIQLANGDVMHFRCIYDNTMGNKFVKRAL